MRLDRFVLQSSVRETQYSSTAAGKCLMESGNDMRPPIMGNLQISRSLTSIGIFKLQIACGLL